MGSSDPPVELSAAELTVVALLRESDQGGDQIYRYARSWYDDPELSLDGGPYLAPENRP